MDSSFNAYPIHNNYIKIIERIFFWAIDGITGAWGCELANCRALCTDPLASGIERSWEQRAKYMRIYILNLLESK